MHKILTMAKIPNNNLTLRKFSLKVRIVNHGRRHFEFGQAPWPRLCEGRITLSLSSGYSSDFCYSYPLDSDMSAG